MRRVSRAFTVATLLVAVTSGNALGAQSLPGALPPPAQAEAMLRERPELAETFRARVRSSGLALDEVRARLRSAGYADAFIAQLLEGLDAPAGTTAAARADSGNARPGASAPPVDGIALRREALAAAGMTADADEDARDATLPRFGLDVFRRATTQFDPLASGPVPRSYRLGAGDELLLVLTGDVEASYVLPVTRDGFVVIPVVGQVAAASLSLAEFERTLQQRLGAVYAGAGTGADAATRFSVLVSRPRAVQVFVVGDVLAPGAYRLGGAATVLGALYAAGGPSDVGTLRRVAVRRAGRTTATIDVYDYLTRGETANDVRLEDGDVVFVPPHGGLVALTGAVQRPAVYELLGTESAAAVIATAGGLRPDATAANVRIARILPADERGGDAVGRVTVALPSTAGTSVDAVLASTALLAGDSVHVPSIADRMNRRVIVRGSVWLPGAVAWTPGATLASAIRLAGGVREDAYRGRVLIERLRADSTREQLRAVLDDATGGALPLREDDVITVLSLADFRAGESVTIAGPVGTPGTYRFRDGMTLRDLVLEAGGFRPGAELREVEIARWLPRPVNGQLVDVRRVAVDSSWLPDSLAPMPVTGGTDVALSPFDHVLVLTAPDFALPATVTLSGEVRFPGTYALRTKQDRLTDVIARAGGLTDDAYGAGVTFVRERDGVGRIGVDLPAVLSDVTRRDNLLMVDGDSVHVPRFAGVVRVEGAVHSPTGVAWVPGWSVDDYVRAAGGGTALADVDRAYVRQPNGSVQVRRRRFLLFTRVPKPRPGSVVTIPARDPSQQRDVAGIVGSVAQVLGGIVTLVVVLARN